MSVPKLGVAQDLSEDLLKAEVDHAPQVGRAGRHFLNVLEIGVEFIIAGARRPVDRAATFKDSGSVLRIIRVHHRTPIAKSLSGPILKKPKEVMDAAIRAKIVCRARNSS